MAAHVRPAEREDLPQIRSILEYYVLNTVINFLVHAPDLSYVESRFESSTQRQLPYLVAVQTGVSENARQKVVGFTHASPFSADKIGYSHSVEMTIFCHPDHVKQGLGGLLMSSLLTALRTTKHLAKEAHHDDLPVQTPVKKIIAVMAVDDTGPDHGLALRDWYLKWGFEQVGHLKGVGFKHGRMIDTMFLEKSL